MLSTTNKIFAIRDKNTQEFVSFGAKCAWMTTGAAKSAFALHTRKLFNDQNDYELVNLAELAWMYYGLQS